MRPHLYILDDKGEPVALPVSTGVIGGDDESFLKWGELIRSESRRVASETIDGLFVSTVFLGVDHGWGDGPAILWETMIFADKANDGHPLDKEQMRCSGSREQALAMHQKMVEKVRSYKP